MISHIQFAQNSEQKVYVKFADEQACLKQTWTFSADTRNSAVFALQFYFFNFFFSSSLCRFQKCIFFVFSTFWIVLKCHISFQYCNFYSWISFICLICFSLPNLYFYTIRSFTIFLKVLNKLYFIVFTQA